MLLAAVANFGVGLTLPFDSWFTQVSLTLLDFTLIVIVFVMTLDEHQVWSAKGSMTVGTVIVWSITVIQFVLLFIQLVEFIVNNYKKLWKLMKYVYRVLTCK